VLRLRKRNEVVDRAGVGGEIARAVDVGEIDPAAEGERDALVADLAVGTGLLRRLVGRDRDRARLRLDLPFLAALVVDALLELLELGLERADLRRRIVFRESLTGREQQATDNNEIE